MSHFFTRFLVLLCTVQMIISLTAQTAHSSDLPSDQQCLQRLLSTAPDTMTFGEARSACKQEVAFTTKMEQPATTQDNSPVEERLNIDTTNILKPFTLMSHRNNYILLGAHSFKGWEPTEFERQYGIEGLDLDNTEVQFQLSIKTPLAVNLFDRKIDIFAGYTVRSFWQFYNSDISSPFRETNHEPEIWLQIRPDREFFGFQNTVNGIGLNHMSNGQGGYLSRSWNRVYGALAFERGNFAFLLRPWFRIHEDIDDDDNPDITDYYGHGELYLAYKYKEHTFSFMTRNNLESGFSHGAFELGWSFPLFQYPFLKGYIQYFSGYGESLIDYDSYVSKIGIGLQLTDVL